MQNQKRPSTFLDYVLYRANRCIHMYTFVHTYACTACKVLSHLEVVQGTPLYGFHAQSEVRTNMKRVAPPQPHSRDSMWLRLLICSIRPAFLSFPSTE